MLIPMSTGDKMTVGSPTLFRPVWADPGFISSINDYHVSDVVLGMGTTVKVANNNPKRWALGFIPPSSLMVTALIGPWSDVSTAGWPFVYSGGVLWFYLFQHGPILTSEWYCNSNSPVTIRVVECEIH